MTDRELLVLAAKAVGIDVDADGRFAYPNGLWNPLTDDGDALRLTVKLSLDILQDSVSSKDNAVEVQGNFENVEFQPWAWENRAPDPYAATRRAIVRAAAEIGKATKG